MTFAFAFLAVLMVASAGVAMLLRNLIHSALLLVLSWAGVAVFYLWAGAQFVAFAQLLVYVGAISMVVLFAVLLTRRSAGPVADVEPATFARAAAGLLAAGLVGGVLGATMLRSHFPTATGPAPKISVHDIGMDLMGPQVAALLVIGVILTVSLIGAVVIAATDPAAADKEDKP